MNTNKMTTETDKKVLLSTLWLFMLLNMLFRDVHELFRVGMLEEMMTGVVNGTPVTEKLMLLGGVMVEIPISMMLSSRLLPYRVNRRANLILAPLTIAIILQSGVRDLDDIFFATIEVVALLAIAWLAWRWRESGSSQPKLSKEYA